MPTRDGQHASPDEPRLPDELAGRLSAMHDRKLFVSSDLDDAVLARAREHFGEASPTVTRRFWLRIAVPAAAAAMIALGVWVAWPGGNHAQQSTIIAVAGDADGSGVVDVLDAFTMARALDAGQPAPPTWDVTGDGRVDRDDVSAVAAIAVSLSGNHTPIRGASS